MEDLDLSKINKVAGHNSNQDNYEKVNKFVSKFIKFSTRTLSLNILDPFQPILSKWIIYFKP